jgi:hypothetical protein
LQNRVMSNLAIVRKLDPKRFEVLETECELDFYDALTGGDFQVKDRASDYRAGERTKRYADRLSRKISGISATPSARGWFSRK